jgi:outer membrane biosynthesis protein TonB
MMMPKNWRFWRNVTLIALAHVVLITGVIRWSLAARASNSESIVWLGSAENLSTGESNKQEAPGAKHPTPPTESSPLKDDELEEEKPVVAQAKSEIELPLPTPKPTPIPTPKPIPKPAPKKVLVAKASSKPSAKAKLSPAKASEKSEKKGKNALAKSASAPESGSGKTGSADKGAKAGGGSRASEFGWYGNMLHDRFYSAWSQPTTNITTGAKISTLVKVRIEKDGRVSKFEIIKPSENVVVNESVATVAKQVTQVDPPPLALIKGDHYDVKINFELSTDRAPANDAN